MKNAFNKLIATATILLSFLTMTSAQSKAPTPAKAAVPAAQSGAVHATSPVSEAAKTQVNSKVSAGATKSAEPFGKQPTEHSQSGGHSKFSMPVDKNIKVNVQKAAVKAKQQ
jgi:hypothetical protein